LIQEKGAEAPFSCKGLKIQFVFKEAGKTMDGFFTTSSVIVYGGR